MYQFEGTKDFAEELDKNDILREFKKRFYYKEDNIYLCGNSLGLASKDAEDSVLKVINIWKNDGVKLWSFEDNKYHFYSRKLAKLLSPLVGADAEEIAVTGSTTNNIHQAIATFYKPTKEKYKILVDDQNFPTDRFAVESQVKLKGYDINDAVKVVTSNDGEFIEENDIIRAMTKEVAIVLLPLVYYKTAQIIDAKKISEVARERGIVIGWDLSHGIGAIEIDLKNLDVDFAVWCSYKYLNGGPGCTAGLYVNKKHFTVLPGLIGWHGNKPETQFLLRQEFDHEQNASGWQIGTPSILSMATLEGSLKVFGEAGISNIRAKSLKITSYLMYLIETKLSIYGFTIGNRKDDSKRGGHVCLQHNEAYPISLALRYRGVVSDFRGPDVIRLTPVALYTSYMDVYTMSEILMDIMKTRSYLEFSGKRNIVL